MGNPFVEALHEFKAPEGDFVNEESIGELVQICPAVSSIMNGGDAATTDPANRGFLSAMGIIYDMIAGSGLEGSLSGITAAFTERIDKLVIGGHFSLVRDGTPLIPAIVDLMAGKPKPFACGIVLALSCVVKRAEEDYGAADAVMAYPMPPPGVEEAPAETAAPSPALIKPQPPTNLDWTKTGPGPGAATRPDDITKILADLSKLGIPLSNISLRPEETKTGIKLSIAIQLSEIVTFEEVAKINAIVMALRSKPIELKSNAGIWVSLSL
jgi:hypothetical protein